MDAAFNEDTLANPGFCSKSRLGGAQTQGTGSTIKRLNRGSREARQGKIEVTGLLLEKNTRATTGISGLDHILGGGLTKHRVYLVEGTPGTGKTTLSLQFLLEGVRLGEMGLYITLSETAEELSAVAATHGWSLEPLSLFELVNQGDLDPEREQTILHPSEVELGETTREVMKRVEELRPSRVVFDSLSEECGFWHKTRYDTGAKS